MAESYTINQWCELNKISRPFFYKLQKRGEAPRTYSVGRCRRISAEAASAWLKAREAASQEAA